MQYIMFPKNVTNDPRNLLERVWMKKVFRLLYYSETSLYRHPLNTNTLLLQTVFLVRSPYIDLTHLIWTLC